MKQRQYRHKFNFTVNSNLIKDIVIFKHIKQTNAMYARKIVNSGTYGACYAKTSPFYNSTAVAAADRDMSESIQSNIRHRKEHKAKADYYRNNFKCVRDYLAKRKL